MKHRSVITRQSRFLRIVALTGLTISLAGCGATSHGAPEGPGPRARELVDIHDRVLSYTAGLRPGGPYTPPDRSERDRLFRAVGQLLEGDAARAETLLTPLGLRVTRLTDTGSGRRYDEIAATGPGRASQWGRLYLTADSRTRWNVQVPHPVSDQDTERLGLRLLEGGPGGSLVLAGAHRKAGRDGAADVAHRQDSAFHTIVEALQRHGVPGLQVHGFAESSGRPYDAVVSSGAAQSAPGAASALADRLEAGGLRVCRGWSAHCPLEGTLNAQGRSAVREHSQFLHVELAPGARGDGPDAAEAAGALGELLAGWAAG
jgi:hypothetical protein